MTAYLVQLSWRQRRRLIRKYFKETMDAPAGPLGRNRKARRQYALKLTNEEAKQIAMGTQGSAQRWLAEVSSDEWLRVAEIWLQPHITQVALLFAKTEMDKIRLQFRRIRQDAATVDALHRPEVAHEKWTDLSYQRMRHEAMTALFADIHFLLICLDKLDPFLRIIEKSLPNESELAGVRASFNQLLKDSNDFRNHMERIDERVQRGVSDLGNLTGSDFTFDGQKFSVGPARERDAFLRNLPT